MVRKYVGSDWASGKTRPAVYTQMACAALLSMDNVSGGGKGVNRRKDALTQGSPLLYPSVKQGELRFSRGRVYREFTHTSYGERMHERSTAALVEAPWIDVSPTEKPAVLHAFAPAELYTEPLGERVEWQLAQRIAASQGFRKSELLQRFVLEICELSLRGRAREITEQYLGIRIFGRPEGYDPGEDNIVRSYARTLRKRLDIYFDGEGAQEPLRLTVPRGGYVPVFTAISGARKPAAPEVPDAIAPQLPQELTLPAESAPKPAVRAHWRWAAGGALAGVLAILMIWVIAYTVQIHRRRTATHALWTQLFEKNRNTLIVPADSGLGIVENLTQTQATVDGYASGMYFAGLRAPAGVDQRSFNDLNRQHYTSAVSLGIGAALTHLPEFTADRTQIRFARSLAVEEMRNANVILLGSSHSNPWVLLFEPRLNFQFVYTLEVDRSFIVNRHPQAGEQAQYANGTAGGHAPTFATVAYLPDTGGAAHVLIVEGLNMAGTQAAANILFSPAAMQPVLRAASGPGGRLHAFEMLIETTSVNASAPAARVIATRVYPESQIVSSEPR